MATQQNQILAIEKGIKTRTMAELTEFHKITQKSSLMNGQSRKFHATHEDGEHFPDENQHVQYNYRDVFNQLQKSMVGYINITGTKDWTNCEAKADVKINGDIIIPQVPATHLLFLEKQLKDLETFVLKIAQLDPGEEWSWDASEGYHRTGTLKQNRTKKVQEGLVLHPPTKEHPAQTQMVTKDVTIGYWHTVKYSGAIERSEKKNILARIEIFSNAVKMAREEANRAEAKQQHHGKAVMDFVFGTNSGGQ